MTHEQSDASRAHLQLSDLPPFVFIGFRVKRVTPCPEWLTNFGVHAAVVREICSMSDCVAKAPDGWIERWDWNARCCYDTPEQAWNTVPANEQLEYRLFAYRMLPIRFDKSGSTHVENPFVLPEPDSSDFSMLGYDIAAAPLDEQNVLGFQCSPLSCNGCAAHWEVNEYCLLKDLATAVKCAQNFAETEPEPGPFYIYEVLRKVAG